MERPRLILIHGFAGSPACFRTLIASLSRKTSPALAIQVQTLTITGHDGAMPEPGDFDCEVQRLLACIPSDAGPAPHLLGYSLGGRLALGLALAAPDQFESLVLIGTHPGLDSEEERRQRCASDEAWSTCLQQLGTEEFLNAWENQPLFQSQRGLNAAVVAAQRRNRSAHSPFALAAALRKLSLGRMPNYAARLAELTLPVDLVTGEFDEKFDRVAKTLLTGLPQAQHHSVPGTGHNVVLENPEWLASLLATSAKVPARKR